MHRSESGLAFFIVCIVSAGCVATEMEPPAFTEVLCKVEPDWVVIYMKSAKDEKEVHFVSTGVKFLESPVWNAIPYSLMRSIMLTDIQDGVGTLAATFSSPDGSNQMSKVVGRISSSCFESVRQYLKGPDESAHVTAEIR